MATLAPEPKEQVEREVSEDQNTKSKKNNNNNEPDSDHKPSQPIFSTITKHGLQTYTGPLEFCEPESILSVGAQAPCKLENEKAKVAIWNAAGTMLAVATGSEVILYDAQGTIVKSLEVNDASDIQFSPNGTYLLVLTRLKPNLDNFFIFNAPDDKKEPVFVSRVQRIFFRPESNFAIFSTDEKVFAWSTKSEIQFFHTPELQRYYTKLVNPNLMNFALSPVPEKKGMTVAVATSPTQGRPGSVILYSYPQLTEITRKSCFGIDEVYFYWNSRGTHLAFVTKASMDKKNTNYNEESFLYYFSADGKKSEQVDLKKEGPIHDLAWNPSGDQLAVVYGLMPPLSSIFDLDMKMTISLGSDWRNTVKWAPNGKALMLGGFGALPGEMDFWDPKKLKKLATVKASNSSVQLWSPDSRHLISGIIHARMKMDNSVRIYKYDGTIVHSMLNLDPLHQVFWKPQDTATFPNKHYFVPKNIETTQPPKPTKYVPPHMRNKPTATNTMMAPNTTVHDPQLKPQKFVAAAPLKKAPTTIVGADPASQKKKNKRPKGPRTANAQGQQTGGHASNNNKHF